MRRIILLPFLAIILISFVFSFPAKAGAESNTLTTPHARTYLEIAEMGEQQYLAWHFALQPGWHVYWQNPGDSGAPPQLKFNNFDSNSLAPVPWPVPEIVEQGPFVTYAYHDRVTFYWQITGTLPETLSARADWLICEEICIPESGDFSLNTTMPRRQITQDTLSHLPQPVSASLRYNVMDKTVIISIPDGELKKLSAKPHWVFPLTTSVVENAQPQTLDRKQTVIRAARSDYFSQAPPLIEVLIQTEGGPRLYTAAYDAAFSAPVSSSAPLTPNELETGIGLILLMALAGGILLNIMPCVFPVLSIKILSYVNKAGKDRGEIRREGLIYTAGVIVSFIAIALAVAILKVSGQAVGWGFQLQSPQFILFLIFLFFLMGLSLSGLFEVGTSLMGIGQNLTDKKGTRGAFLTGVLATVVATPCMGPFMAPAIGYALSRSFIEIFAVFFTLGLGLALPYLILTWWPQLIKKLPRPGPWMITFKEAMAFPLYLTVAALLWVFSQQTSPDMALLALCGLVLIGFVVWVIRRASSPKIWWVFLLITLGIMIAIISPQPAVMPSSSNHEAYTAERLTELRQQNTPVFVNMTAAWCLTCKVNERVAISRQSVQQAFAENGVIYLEGDWTRYDADITAFLESFGRSGVPLYVYYPPQEEPTVLPQLLTPQIILDVLKP